MQSGTRTESEAQTQETDYLLGSPAAGRVITAALVVGIAAAVGIAMVSVVAMVVTGVAGAVTAYLVAHDDDWVRRARHRRARRRHVTVAPGWAGRAWSGQSWGEHGIGRHAA